MMIKSYSEPEYLQMWSKHYYLTPHASSFPATELTILKTFSLNLQEKFAGVDIRVTVKGGGHVAQVYAIRQAISKALIAFYQKCKSNFYNVSVNLFSLSQVTTLTWSSLAHLAYQTVQIKSKLIKTLFIFVSSVLSKWINIVKNINK